MKITFLGTGNAAVTEYYNTCFAMCEDKDVFLVDAGGGKYQLAGQPGSISGATSPDKYVSEDGEKNPWGGVVIYRADFYHMSPPNPARYKGKSWKRLGRPMFSVNMSFRR